MTGRQLSFEASVFTRLVFNQIEWEGYDVATSTAFPVNIQKTLLPGAEVHATARVTKEFSLEASYSFIYSLILQDMGLSYGVSDNIRVPFVPLHNLSVSGRYSNGIHSATVELHYVSEKFTDSVNTPSLALPGYVIHGCRL